MISLLDLDSGVSISLSTDKSLHILKVYLVISMTTRPGVAKTSTHIIPIMPGGEQSSMVASILFNLFYTVVFKSTNTDMETGIMCI